MCAFLRVVWVYDIVDNVVNIDNTNLKKSYCPKWSKNVDLEK